MQVHEKKGSMEHKLLTSEDGFKCIVLVKSHHHQVFTNGKFLVFLIFQIIAK